jgi:hypothetical protein
MGKALHPLNPLLTTKTLATRAKRTQAAAVMMAMMVTKLPSVKKTLLRLILQSRNF